MNRQNLYKGTLFWRPSLLNLGYNAVGILFYKKHNGGEKVNDPNLLKLVCHRCKKKEREYPSAMQRAFEERIDKKLNSALSRPSFAAVYLQAQYLRGGILMGLTFSP